MNAVSWPDARERAATAAAAVAPRELPLELAAGAVLAADVVARTDLPPADTSAMDGWAVAGPGPWGVRGGAGPGGGRGGGPRGRGAAAAGPGRGGDDRDRRVAARRCGRRPACR